MMVKIQISMNFQRARNLKVILWLSLVRLSVILMSMNLLMILVFAILTQLVGTDAPTAMPIQKVFSTGAQLTTWNEVLLFLLVWAIHRQRPKIALILLMNVKPLNLKMSMLLRVMTWKSELATGS